MQQPYPSTLAATHYDVLKVSRQAGPDGVRRAYRSLAQRFHPDKLGGHADAVQIMAALNEAYAVLSDPERRADYDRAISRPAPLRASCEAPRIAAWPWWLIFGTAAFSVASIGTVAYHMMVPTAAAQHVPVVKLSKN